MILFPWPRMVRIAVIEHFRQGLVDSDTERALQKNN